ncbi:MAG TPA: putative quinol monooxygenase [Acidimicrobiales bacterium]|nr:putative quinol monooxygenase [Acidimicrobiales bacterium]
MSDSNIAIMGYIEVAPEDRERWLELAVPLVAKTRQEPGALDYSIGADLVEPGRIILHERYTSLEALKEHMASKHFQTFMAAAREIPIVSGPNNSRFYQGEPFSYGPSVLGNQK